MSDSTPRASTGWFCRGYLNRLGVDSFSVGEIGNLAFRESNDQIIIAYGYNDTIIKTCDFKLSAGVWFTDSNSKFVPAVVIGNRFNIGEIIRVSSFFDSIEYDLEIIGRIDYDSFILTFDRSASRGASSVDQFISRPQNELILPYSSRIYNGPDKTLNPNYIEMEKSLAELIIFENTYQSEIIKDILFQYGHTTYIDDMLSNYEAAVSNELLVYMIVCLVFTALTLVGIGGNNGIQNMLNEHQFIIYYMLGASQKKCVWIEATRASLLILTSFILALLLHFIFPSLFPADSMRITVISWMVILLYLIFVFVLTSGIFLFRLGRKNLAATYKEKA